MSKRKSSTESKPFKVLKRSLDQNIEEDIGFIDESEYEDILNLSVITMSDEKEEFEEEIQSKDSNEAYSYQKTLFSEKIANNYDLTRDLENRFIIKDVKSDGNCFFNASLIAFDDDEANHANLRAAACTILSEHIDFFAGEAKTRDELEDYIKKHRLVGTWAEDLIIYSTALLLSITIEVYVPGYLQPIIVNEGQESRLFSLNSNNNHFEVLSEIKKSSKPKLKKRKKRKIQQGIEEKWLISLRIDFNDLKQDALSNSCILGNYHIVTALDITDNKFLFPKDGKSVYNEVFNYKIQGILPEIVLNKPDIKKNSRSKSTILSRRYWWV